MDNVSSRPFNVYTTKELRTTLERGPANSDAIRAEIARREQVEAGNVSVMTPGERLRFVKTGRA